MGGGSTSPSPPPSSNHMCFAKRLDRPRVIACNNLKTFDRLYQGFINVFFFFFLGERNNRVRVTNYQSPLSQTQFFDLRRQRQLSDRSPGIFYFQSSWLVLVVKPATEKICRTLSGRETVSDSVCSVSCYLLSMRLLSFSFTTFYCIADHATLSL